MTPSGDISQRGSEAHVRQADRRAFVLLPIAAVLVLFSVVVSPAQEFRIGDWRAYALVGPAGLDAETQYVSFSGDKGPAAWLPDEQDLVRYTEAEASLLSRFQLKVVNLEGPFPGLSGNPLDRRIDEALLYNLTTAGYDLAGWRTTTASILEPPVCAIPSRSWRAGS